MIDISKYPSIKYILFGILYFSEGLSFTICSVIVIMYLTELDISISTATLVAGIAASPFILKFLVGPITDYFIKYGRKIFVIMGGLIGSICLFPIAFIDPSVNLIPFTTLLFISHVGVVFLDVSADAWAIQITKPDERGKVNSAMFTGLFGGAAITAFVLSIIANSINFQTTFIISGLIIILTIILPLLIKEIKEYKKRPKIAKMLVSEFKKKNTILIALFGLISATNFGIIILILPEYMLNSLGLDVAQTGFISTLSTIGVSLGAIAGGIIADKWNRKKTLFIFLSGALIFTVSLITASSWQTLVIIYPIFGFFQGGASYAALMAMFMDITNPKIGATQYSFLTSISNFGEIGIGMFSGPLVVILGYHRLFLYAAWILGPGLLILYFIKDTKL